MHWSHINTDDQLYTYEYFSQEDFCRLCWNKNANVELSNENTENSLIDLIKQSLGIDIDTMYPNKLCENCSNEIKRFNSFKQFCLEADKKLESILANGLNEEDNRHPEISVVKEEMVDDDFDKLEEFLDNSITLEEPEPTKYMRRNVYKKNYKRSSTYCRVCWLELENKEAFSAHNSESHGIEKDGSFRCFGCDKRFKNRKTCISHELNFCKGLKDGYKCNICNRYLPKRSTYEYHMRDHRHNILLELPEHIFKCPKCGELFKSKDLLTKHMSDHGKEKSYICDICGRMFTRQDYLYKHKLTHTGTKNHECPHCDFKATQRSSLTIHLRVHSGERPYACDRCPLRCISSSNLRAHKRRHLGVKKFECAICNKKFGYKKTLEEHISSAHVRSITHACEHCGATYSRIRGLRRHLGAKHGKESKDKTVEETVAQVNEEDSNKIQIIKDVEYELKDSENVLLLKHQDGDVYMV